MLGVTSVGPQLQRQELDAHDGFPNAPTQHPHHPTQPRQPSAHQPTIQRAEKKKKEDQPVENDISTIYAEQADALLNLKDPLRIKISEDTSSAAATSTGGSSTGDDSESEEAGDDGDAGSESSEDSSSESGDSGGGDSDESEEASGDDIFAYVEELDYMDFKRMAESEDDEAPEQEEDSSSDGGDTDLSSSDAGTGTDSLPADDYGPISTRIPSPSPYSTSAASGGDVSTSAFDANQPPTFSGQLTIHARYQPSPDDFGSLVPIYMQRQPQTSDELFANEAFVVYANEQMFLNFITLAEAQESFQQQGQQSELDINSVARDVYREIRNRLMIEWERGRARI